ncbi:hypothetical protein E4T56_gene1444 [Termitomyces sp. T112]|nr:hypothetical protein E4T56_gene1444 [Termitomyces sp. T112]
MRMPQHSYTRPDNVWRSHSAVDPIISCDVNASLHPSHADHLPIVTEVELPIPHSSSPPSRDFCHNTSDAMHPVISRIKDAWHTSKVAMALFLDVQGAFPSTVRDRLLHNMKELRVPSAFIHLVERTLSNCQTKLKFNNYCSDWLSVNNGTTQGCPLSMLFYAFYNAPLLCIIDPSSRSELSSGFVDDVMFLATAEPLMETHAILKDIMEHTQSTFLWSLSHHSAFELLKLALMNFPQSFRDSIPTNLSLQHINLNQSTATQVINTIVSYKYLGVVFDPKL